METDKVEISLSEKTKKALRNSSKQKTKED